MSRVAPAERLNRYLARSGVASRRAADAVIAEGRVRINGRAARLGDLVDPSRDRVSVDGRGVAAPSPALTVLLNKPPGYVSTLRDPHGRPTVVDLLPAELAALKPVGRLDADSRGLLLMTSDGELAHRVAHPRFAVHKRYRVTARVAVTGQQLQRLARGALLEDGFARPLEVTQRSQRTLELTLGEGRKREVRRLCAAADIEVVDLIRVAIGPLRLGRLAEGMHRPLTGRETARLLDAVGLTDGD